MGKGSKPRPLAVDRKEFENNWDKIFSERTVEVKEHKRKVVIEEPISRFFSDNGKREAVVLRGEKGFSVVLFEGSRYIRTVDCSKKSINWAEDVAENWTLGVLYE